MNIQVEKNRLIRGWNLRRVRAEMGFHRVKLKGRMEKRLKTG